MVFITHNRLLLLKSRPHLDSDVIAQGKEKSPVFSSSPTDTVFVMYNSVRGDTLMVRTQYFSLF